MKKFLFALLALSLIQNGTLALADTEDGTNSQEDTTATTVTEGESTTKAEKQSKDSDLDEEIANARLRAASGSKSKWSGSLSTGYTGSSLAKPFAKIIPNISAPGRTRFISLGLSSSVRYRFNKNTSLTAGTGVSVLSPYTKPKYTLSGASLGLGSTYKWQSLQMSSGVGMGVALNQRARDEGELMGFSISQSILYGLKTIPLTMGVSFSSFYDLFDKATTPSHVDYGVGTYPFVEYALSDNYILRTLVGFRAFHYRQEESMDTFFIPAVYQSVGLGVVVTRDIYLYPNVQFIPEDARAERTNVGFSATINMM